MKNIYKQGHPKKGIFAPHDRPLVTTEFMKEAKRRDIPPPGHYNLPPADKPKGCVADKAEKSSYHIDMAIYQAKQTPTVCYTSLESLTSATKPRVLTSKLQEPKIKKEDLGKKPKKDTGPDMGTYEPTKSIKYIERKELSQKWDSGPIKKFYDIEINRAKKVPAPNFYEVTDGAFNRLSKSPNSIRVRRH